MRLPPTGKIPNVFLTALAALCLLWADGEWVSECHIRITDGWAIPDTSWLLDPDHPDPDIGQDLTQIIRVVKSALVWVFLDRKFEVYLGEMQFRGGGKAEAFKVKTDEALQSAFQKTSYQQSDKVKGMALNDKKDRIWLTRSQWLRLPLWTANQWPNSALDSQRSYNTVEMVLS